jgi:hypothetical protein
VQVHDSEQLELFDEARWPRRPYCTDAFEDGVRIRSLKQALTKSYIQANPPRLRVWCIFDIDRSGGGLAWEDANLLPPSWATVSKANGHAHLVWGLSAPVLVDGLGARDAPLRYLCAIESLMRSKLQADPGYSGLITKNPSHPLWHTLRGPRLAYDLQELAEYLPGLEKHRPKRRVEEVGLGRNVTLFDAVRKWAYTAIRPYWGGGLDGWNAFLSSTNTRALVYNSDFKDGLDGREVWHIAKSVAKWTWKNTTAQGFSEWQSVQGAKGGKKGMLQRWGDNEDKQASARLMAAAGRTHRAIAAELGVTQSTVTRWLKST